jgi:hypothetical protein
VVDHAVLGGHAGPKVLDADTLNHFAQRAHELRDAAGPCLLTPHPAEAHDEPIEAIALGQNGTRLATTVVSTQDWQARAIEGIPGPPEFSHSKAFRPVIASVS